MSSPLHAPPAALDAWSALLQHAGVDADALKNGAPGDAWIAGDARQLREDEMIRVELDRLGDDWSASGRLFVAVSGDPSDADLAAVRNSLWPRAHVGAVYRVDGGELTCRTLQGVEPVGAGGEPGVAVLSCQRTSWVLSPEATQTKFDTNASGWNGNPGSPGYPHFRWMRKYVGRFGPPARSGASILDFGCGAGWVGIEAALAAGSAKLRFFDPSPSLVQFATDNARASGISDSEGSVGFGEDPPYPAEGEDPFDLVLSSGVVSFARDFEQWMDGLVRAVRPGGTLVIGDIYARSRGMRSRRHERPLLPIRELNAKTPAEVRAWLEGRGFTHEDTAGYQLTWPIPQAMHFNESKLKGALSRPLVWLNAAAAELDRRSSHRLESHFDSWVMRFGAPA